MISKTAASNLLQSVSPAARPILKWAGGKSQLLEQIRARFPKSFGTYLEPFFGGGAVFFSLLPEDAVIADINPELINLYRTLARDLNGLIASLEKYTNSAEEFYSVRAKDWEKLTQVEAAARTIYLNKTCFNGLYRVNRSGKFNVPYGHYKNPKILDEQVLLSAHNALANTKIVEGSFGDVLKKHAKKGDLVFLDPPYLPISKLSDFRRYTKEQFYEDDHHELANEVHRLHELGCHVILTNSNHPLVSDLYSGFSRVVLNTKRHISCNGSSRVGEDVIVDVPPRRRLNLKLVVTPDRKTENYPSTRYMGAKSKLLDKIWGVASQFEFSQAVDLFSGSGVVGYMFKAHGKQVLSNDYMSMATVYAKAMIENNDAVLSMGIAQSLLEPSRNSDGFVENTFRDLYFQDEENILIDNIRANIAKLRSSALRNIAKAALIRACLKKRPRGIFTYVGHRYDDGRRDLRLSLGSQFLDAVVQINAAIFDNGLKNVARNGDAMTVKAPSGALVYMDPPYFSPYSDNEYVRRYHFVEGLARDWQGVEIQQNTQTKKFKSYPTPFSSRAGAADAFEKLFKKFRENILIVSYSSNSLPTLEEMVELMSRYKNQVDVIPIDHRYSFGNQGNKVNSNRNAVNEYLFVGH